MLSSLSSILLLPLFTLVLYSRWRHVDRLVAPDYVQPWYTHDVSLVKKFRIKDMNFKATLKVNNLFDQDYEVIFNYPMPKRNYRFSLVVEL